MSDRIRDVPTLWEMVKHPWQTLARISQLDRLPDRRVSRRPQFYGSSRGHDSSDPLRREARSQQFYRALGVFATEESRIELYWNFREMDTDSLVSAVLDEYGKNASQKDPERKRVLWVEAKNSDIARILSDTLDRLEMERKAYPILRGMARDGDVFLHAAGARGKGVIALRPYEPWVAARIEDDIGRLIGFAPADEMGKPSREADSAVPHYRVLHFRLPSRDMTIPYGADASYLWGSRITWRQLQLMEDQVVIQRLLRRPDRLMVLMDTTGLTHDEAWMMIHDYERRMYREWYFTPENTGFESFGAMPDVARDVVLPRGTNNQTSIENFPATNQNDLLRDLDHFLARLAAGMGFPLGYLGRGEVGQYAPGQSLARQWAPFARRAALLQEHFLVEVARMLMIDLAFRGLNPYRSENAFTVNMATVSPLEEIERNEVIQLKTDRLERSVRFGMDAKLNMAVWTPFCLERYGGFSRDFIKKVFQGASDEAGGGGMGPWDSVKELPGELIQECDEGLADLWPVVESALSKGSKDAMTVSQVTEDARESLTPKGNGVCEGSVGSAEHVSDHLEDGLRLHFKEADRFMAESKAEHHRESAMSRVKIISALSGLPLVE